MTTAGMLIQDRPVFAVQQTATVFDAAAFMAEKNIGAIAVLDGSRLTGILSERDVITRIVAKRIAPESVEVGRVMTRDLVVAEIGESKESCLRKMKAANCRHLPVVSGEELLGIISLRDLLQVELTDRDETLEFLNNYLFHLPPGLREE